MNGACNGIFFLPHPLGLSEASKSQISFNFNHKVNFKDFYTRLYVCVFSQMKDTKHIRQDFHSVAWVMHLSGTWGA